MIVPTVEGLQLCIANGDRLIRDSGNVSEPTQVALLELAIEELVKGWMMFFALSVARFTGPMPELPPVVAGVVKAIAEQPPSPEIMKKLAEYFATHGEELKNPPLTDAFERHHVKLAYVETIVGYLTNVMPLVERIRPPQEVVDVTIGGAYRAPEHLDPAKIQKLEATLHALKAESLESLTDLKEHGIYVDVTAEGNFISPMGLFFKPKPLAELADVLSAGARAGLAIYMRLGNRSPGS